MNWQGWAEIALTIGLSVALAWPLGLYLAAVFGEGRTWLDPVLKPVERGFYRAAGVDETRGQTWIGYAAALLAFNAAGFFLLYAILRLQGVLPLNPLKFPGLSPHLAFNTAVSFVTNTNWQSYSGESTMSNLSQMSGLAVQNFMSAAIGVAVVGAVARAFAAHRGETVGNFWRDLTRITLYVLLPLSLVMAIALVVQGVPQTLAQHVDATTLEGAKQTLTLGPVASQEAIKQIGTNGGGFFNANSSHPYENPTPLTNFIAMVAMNCLGFACVIAFGVIAGARKEARALVAAMVILLSAAAAAIYVAETQPVPALQHALHVTPIPNMEGKEVRFGAAASAVFTAMTTGASCGAINAWHESYTPMGGGIAMFMIQLGEILPGGVGSGLYGMVVMALFSVFIAGLMVGRTPEYLGKKVEAREVKFALLAVLILPACILGFTAAAAVLPEALKGLAASAGTPHGFSEMLYAYSSAAGNNGSAFGGLTANAPWWDTTLGITMALGRFAYLVPVMAIAGAVVAKPKLAPSAGTLPTDNALFVGLLIGVILILGGLQFFPAL
ncbi:MAG: potassium-transporting ATPase subunit KdpA, partial [Caulobacteraceae bacterium]|nr:potassium-transporting ATPase subunit KdpA [Caulobacter sp.]